MLVYDCVLIDVALKFIGKVFEDINLLAGKNVMVLDLSLFKETTCCLGALDSTEEATTC